MLNHFKPISNHNKHYHTILNHIKPLSNHIKPPNLCVVSGLLDPLKKGRHTHTQRLQTSFERCRFGVEPRLVQDGAPKIAMLPYRWLKSMVCGRFCTN